MDREIVLRDETGYVHNPGFLGGSMNDTWQVIEEVSGSAIAEMLRGLLEAQEIPVYLSQEGAGHFSFPTMVGPLSAIQILVPRSKFKHAKEVLDAYHNGTLSVDDAIEPQE
jgi:hypothetical protein